MTSKFVKADARNLPLVNSVMILEYMATSSNHNVAEIRGAKALIAMERSMLHIKRKDRIRNKAIREKTQVEDVTLKKVKPYLQTKINIDHLSYKTKKEWAKSEESGNS